MVIVTCSIYPNHTNEIKHRHRQMLGYHIRIPCLHMDSSSGMNCVLLRSTFLQQTIQLQNKGVPNIAPYQFQEFEAQHPEEDLLVSIQSFTPYSESVQERYDNNMNILINNKVCNHNQKSVKTYKVWDKPSYQYIINHWGTEQIT